MFKNSMRNGKPVNIRTVDCKSVKCYLLKSSNGYLMFDAGWPHLYGYWKDSVKASGISAKDIKTIIVSHFHIDHAGLAGILISNGKEFVVFENQVNYIDEMEALIERKGYKYHKIDKSMMKVKKLAESGKWLNSLDLAGEIIQISGHGDQSIVLLLDTGEALIGDLPVEYEYDALVKSDWDRLYSRGAKYFYPAHADYYEKV